MGLITLVYASAAVEPLDDDALSALLQQSRDKNLRSMVTGMLLYQDGNFMQALEGPEETVLGLEAEIRSDPRHKRMMRLLRRPIEHREFPNWSMGFRKLSSQTRSLGETDFMYRSLSDISFVFEPTRAQRLLLTFRESMAA